MALTLPLRSKLPSCIISQHLAFSAANTALEGLKPGLESAMRAAGSVTQQVVSYRYRNGRIAERREEGSMDLTIVRWQNVQNVLAKHVPQERVHCGHRLTSYRGVKVSAYGLEA